jgi:hypothetical protein
MARGLDGKKKKTTRPQEKVEKVGRKGGGGDTETRDVLAA